MLRIITNLFLLLLCFLGSVSAQVQSISLKTNYTQQVFYNIASGKTTTMDNDAWDLAFSNNGLQDAGVFYNEASSLKGSQMKVWLSEATNWADATADTSKFVDSLALLNPKAKWTEGAFNAMKSSASPFDYGWGMYSTSSNSVVGNRIFVIKLRDGSFIKFQIEKLVLNDYTFKYANLDGSNEIIKVVTKDKTNPNKVFHFSFKTGAVIPMDADYDLVFQRYRTIATGMGVMEELYNVTGVLLAPGTEAVKADGVDFKVVKESDYATLYSKNISTIGYDWKTFDLNTGYTIDDDRVYFIKTRTGEKFKIAFIDFEGSSTGIITLQKEISTATKDELNAQINVYPNPTNDYIQIDGIKNDAFVKIYNNTGQILLSRKINTNLNRIDLTALVKGIYTASIETVDGTIAKKIVKL